MDIEITKSLKSDDTSAPAANTSNISVTQGPHLIMFDCENCKKEFSNRTQLFKHITDPTYKTPQADQRPEEDCNNTAGPWERVGSRFECPICGYTRNTKS